jgi:hypothetical protein
MDPLLTIEVWSANRGQQQVVATRNLPQTEGIEQNE